VGDFNQVESELGFNRAVDLSHLATENHPVELGDHLSRPEFAKAPSLFSGRARGMFPGYFREISAAFDLLLEAFALRLSGDEDMTRFGSRHVFSFTSKIALLSLVNSDDELN